MSSPVSIVLDGLADAEAATVGAMADGGDLESSWMPVFGALEGRAEAAPAELAHALERQSTASAVRVVAAADALGVQRKIVDHFTRELFCDASRGERWDVVSQPAALARGVAEQMDALVQPAGARQMKQAALTGLFRRLRDAGFSYRASDVPDALVDVRRLFELESPVPALLAVLQVRARTPACIS